MEFMYRKFSELSEISPEHNRKQMKETARLGQRIIEILISGGTQDAIARGSFSNEGQEASENDLEPVIFEGRNLLNFSVANGASSFGRLLGAKLFGNGKNCTLMFERLGCKVRRTGGRVPCDPVLKEKIAS